MRLLTEVRLARQRARTQQFVTEALASPTMPVSGLLARLGILAVAGIVILRRM